MQSCAAILAQGLAGFILSPTHLALRTGVRGKDAWVALVSDGAPRTAHSRAHACTANYFVTRQCIAYKIDALHTHMVSGDLRR